MGKIKLLNIFFFKSLSFFYIEAECTLVKCNIKHSTLKILVAGVKNLIPMPGPYCLKDLYLEVQPFLICSFWLYFLHSGDINENLWRHWAVLLCRFAFFCYFCIREIETSWGWKFLSSSKATQGKIILETMLFTTTEIPSHLPSLMLVHTCGLLYSPCKLVKHWQKENLYMINCSCSIKPSASLLNSNWVSQGKEKNPRL